MNEEKSMRIATIGTIGPHNLTVKRQDHLRPMRIVSTALPGLGTLRLGLFHTAVVSPLLASLAFCFQQSSCPSVLPWLLPQHSRQHQNARPTHGTLNLYQTRTIILLPLQTAMRAGISARVLRTGAAVSPRDISRRPPFTTHQAYVHWAIRQPSLPLSALGPWPRRAQPAAHRKFNAF
jgi:hypothetical protein